jgi:hypothetical protein
VDRGNARKLAQTRDFDDVGDDLAAGVRVETGRGLVEEEHRGDGQELEGDVHALALAGRETTDEGGSDTAVGNRRHSHNLEDIPALIYEEKVMVSS